MEWGDKENRIAVIALHKVSMEPNAIFKTLHTLGISQMFVYRAINRYNETESMYNENLVCFILVTGLLFSVSAGIMLGYPAVLTPAIVSINSTDIRTTRDHASWITASNGLGGFFGTFLMSFTLQYFGRKAAHIVLNVTHILGWLMFPFASTITELYAARIIQGLSIGGVYISSIIASEYVHPSRRGYFITLKKVAIASGCFICHAMDAFWTWRQISLFALVLPVIATIMTLFWPESPAYLALYGKFEECKKSFRWLNGNSEESQKHLKSLIEAQMEISRKKKTSLRDIIRKFRAEDFQKPVIIISVLTLILDFCGRYYFVAYVIEIMMTLLDDKRSATYLTLGADLLTVVALLLSTLVIRYFNRRTILFTFGTLTVLLMLSVSLLVYLDKVFNFPTEVIWFTALITVILCFIVNLGVVPVSFALIGEVIPLQHRGLASFVSGVIFTLLYALTLKLTPILIFFTGLYGTYGIYGLLFAVCLVYLYRIVPETKDKTLQEIEDIIMKKKKDYGSAVSNTLIVQRNHAQNS